MKKQIFKMVVVGLLGCLAISMAVTFIGNLLSIPHGIQTSICLGLGFVCGLGLVAKYL